MNEVPKFVAEVMTKDVVTLEEDETLENLDESMRTLRFRHMPVVDGKRLIGLISQRDILRVSASTFLPVSRQQTDLLTKKFAVRDVMTRSVQTVRPETPLGEAARVKEGISCNSGSDARLSQRWALCGRTDTSKAATR